MILQLPVILVISILIISNFVLQFRYSLASDSNLNINSKDKEVCYNSGGQLIGYSGTLYRFR